MKWGEVSELLVEEGVEFTPSYICNRRLVNVGYAYMLLPKARGGGGGKYLICAPREIIKEFLAWLLRVKGCVINELYEKKILYLWKKFYNAEATDPVTDVLNRIAVERQNNGK